jgi:hypothetical protein
VAVNEFFELIMDEMYDLIAEHWEKCVELADLRMELFC